MLSLKNYTVKSIENDKTLINGLNLEVGESEIHLLLGQNGAGKSSLLQSLMGLSGYSKSGNAHFNNAEIINSSPDQLALKRLFLAFQNPVEVPGLKNVEFLKMAYNKLQTPENQLDPWSFADLLEVFVQRLGLPQDTPSRGLNEGFSGGEKRKFEVLQMLMLEPKLIMLDEIDSGLDIDSQKSVFSNITAFYNKNKPSIIIVSHNPKILELIQPTHVHHLNNGQIIKSGGLELAHDIMTKGFLYESK